ncbi:hypothetical protein TSAR_008021 [Trichomalopsis sarcophagae]|uniref:Uncharacterized protein n=1 Tax=Trichomalopsis sarcophagae TaxID=543379 RepID=A0A232FPD8_9HYME|nr:hypothetical protein TSAR_008021 [Trichomalopsis sarcophagae]
MNDHRVQNKQNTDRVENMTLIRSNKRRIIDKLRIYNFKIQGQVCHVSSNTITPIDNNPLNGEYAALITSKDGDIPVNYDLCIYPKNPPPNESNTVGNMNEKRIGKKRKNDQTENMNEDRIAKKG